MKNIANNFVGHENAVCGGAWKWNLWIRCIGNSVLWQCFVPPGWGCEKLFGNSTFCLCPLTPNMNKLIQPIYYGLGWSVSVTTGNYLDVWLMVGENIYQWEDKMNSGEKRILMSNFESNNLKHFMTK